MRDEVEDISEVIHNEWIKWTKSVAYVESLDELGEKIDRWTGLWIPYNQLSEVEKEKDREIARKIINIYKEYMEW